MVILIFKLKLTLPTEGRRGSARSRTALIVSLAAPTTLRTCPIQNSIIYYSAFNPVIDPRKKLLTNLKLLEGNPIYFTFWGTAGDFFPDVAFLASCTLLLLLLGLFVPFFCCFDFTLCCCLWNSKRSANLLISRPREGFWVFLLPHGSEPFPEPLLTHLLTFLFLRLGNFCSSWKSFSRFESRLAGRCRFSLKECLWKFSSFSTPVLSFSESSSISFHSSSCTSSLCSSSPSGDKNCLVPKFEI